MRPDLAHMLDEALERLRAGATIEECLLAYPEHAAELEPMLRTAAAIQRQAVAALPPSLEQWLASGRREIEQIARATYTRPETLGQRLARQLGSFFAGLSRRGGARVASAALSALIICFMSFYTVDAAAARSLPGEYLYSWKLLSEQARISLAADPDRRTRLVAASVERRVAEIAALTERGTSSPALLSETVQRLEDQVSQTLSTLPAASPDTAERTAARVGRLLARAQSDLQAASAPDADSAIVIESAAAEVANLIEDLPAPPPADAAAVVPLPNATADPGAELAEATARPTRAPSATAPPIAVIDRPAGGVSTPGRAPAEAAPGLPEPGAPQSPSGPGEDPSGPIAPTASATRPPSTRTPGPTRTAQPTRTPGPTRTALPTRTPAPTLTPAAPAPGGAGDLPVPTATASATVAPIGEPVVRGSSMEYLYFTYPFLDDQKIYEGGAHGQIDRDGFLIQTLWIFPIYRSEYLDLRTIGIEAFEEQLFEHHRERYDAYEFDRLPLKMQNRRTAEP